MPHYTPEMKVALKRHQDAFERAGHLWETISRMRQEYNDLRDQEAWTYAGIISGRIASLTFYANAASAEENRAAAAVEELRKTEALR